MSEPYSPEVIAYLRELLETNRIEASNARTAQADALNQARNEAESAAVREDNAAELRRLLRHADPDNAAAYADPEPEASAVPPIAIGLREAADLVETHPELANFCYPNLQITPGDGTDAEKLNEANRLALLLGAEPKWTGGNQYVARRGLTGGMGLQVVAITARGPIPQSSPVTGWHQAADGSFHDGAAGGCERCEPPVPVDELGQADAGLALEPLGGAQ